MSAMRSAFRLFVFLLSLALVLPGVVSAGAPRSQTASEHWLTVSRPSVTWSDAVAFEASLATIAIVPPPNPVVEVERSMDGGQTWGRIGVRLAPDGMGGYSASHRPRLTARYRAVLLDGMGAVTATSAVVGVLVRQLAIQRPVHQAAKTIARGTSVTFTTTIRPIGPDLPRAQVLYLIYQRTGASWRQVAFRQVTAGVDGVARLTWRFTTRGEFYVRSKGMGNWRESIDDPGTNFDSIRTPIARFTVR